MKVNSDQLHRQVGAAIKQRREHVGMSQTRLAEEVGLLRTSITNIEAGRQKAPLHILYSICIVLNMELCEVLPSNKEVVKQSVEAVETAGGVKRVPPKAAALLRQMLRD